MRMKIHKGLYQKNTRVIGVSLIIMVIFLINTENAVFPFVFNDEYGYWSNAAWMLGYDWRSTTSEISWYSFGYSFFLAIIIFVVRDFLLAYRIAIFFNCFFLALSYIVLYKISLRFTNKYNEIYAVVPVVYCSNWVNKNYAWPEITLYLLFILITYLIIKIYETQKAKWYVLLGICLVMMYMIHMRTIGIIIASVCFLLLFLHNNKKNFFGLILMLLVGLIMQVVTKKYFADNLWQNSVASLTNGYGTVVSSNVSQIDWKWFISIIHSLLGKIFYVLIATLGILFSLTRNLLHNKKIFKERTLQVDLVSYLLLCIFFVLAISSIFMREPQYTTHMFYGRYTEYIFAPLILLSAIFWCTEEKTCTKCVVIKVVIVCTIAVVLKSVIDATSLTQTNIAINNVALSIFYKDGVLNLYYVALVFSVLNYFIHFLKKHCKIYSFFALIPIVICWCVMGDNAYERQEIHSNNIISKDELKTICEELELGVDNDIYVCKGSNYWKSHACAEILQFYYPHNHVQYIDSINMNLSSKDLVFVFASDYQEEVVESGYLSAQIHVIEQ